MPPVGIHHVAILVTDVDRAIRFYTEVLGFSRIDRPNLGFDGAWLSCGPNELHLIRNSAAEPASRRHVAYAIDDPDGLRATLERARVPFEDQSDPARGRRFFVRDPDQNRIELTTEPPWKDR